MEPYEVYQKYLALKTHFKNDSYDYFKYHGKLKGDRSKFETRKDKYHFYKLSKMKQPVDFMVANMMVNPNFWSGDVSDEKSISIYNDWLRRRDSRKYIFEQEIQKMQENFDSNIIVTPGEHPRQMELFIRELINPEKLKKYQPFFINSVDLDPYKSILRNRFNDKP